MATKMIFTREGQMAIKVASSHLYYIYIYIDLRELLCTLHMDSGISIHWIPILCALQVNRNSFQAKCRDMGKAKQIIYRLYSLVSVSEYVPVLLWFFSLMIYIYIEREREARYLWFDLAHLGLLPSYFTILPEPKIERKRRGQTCPRHVTACCPLKEKKGPPGGGGGGGEQWWYPTIAVNLLRRKK